MGLLVRCRRIILQDAAVYLYFNKVNKHINHKSSVFSSESFRQFQEDIITAINNRSVGRLEEYEDLVPNLVDTHREVASQVTEVNHRIVRLQRTQDDRLEKTKSRFNNYVEQNNRRNYLMGNMTQQLASDVKIIMMQQQCLSSQLQLFMVTQNTNFPQPPSTFPTTFPVFFICDHLLFLLPLPLLLLLLQSQWLYILPSLQSMPVATPLPPQNQELKKSLDGLATSLIVFNSFFFMYMLCMHSFMYKNNNNKKTSPSQYCVVCMMSCYT